MRLVRWQGEDLLRRLDDVIAVYGAAMGYSIPLLQTRRGYIAGHTRRPDFQAVATLDEDDALLGFGYGYRGGPGQWWHDQVRSALRRDARKQWLNDCVERVELHVRPDSQGQKIGGRQLYALLTNAPHKTALLSTPEADAATSRAWRLYRRFGFSDVLRHIHFPGDDRPFAVLGRHLPL